MLRYFLLFGLLSWVLQGQTIRPMVVGVQVDNDSFISTYNDFYYTSGQFLYGSRLAKSSTAAETVVHGFRLGQQIYNPRWIKSVVPQEQNRPYAGYLFAEYTTTHLTKTDRVFANTFQVGIVGPGSGAEGFQKWLHRTFGFGDLKGWHYQIQNTVALQYERLYSRPTLSALTTDQLDFHWYGKAVGGTVSDGLSGGMLARLRLSAKGESLKATNFYNALATGHKAFYLYALPKINWQWYDATIQGSLFDTKSEVTYRIRPFRFTAEVGMRYKYERFNFSYSATYSTTEIENSNASGYFYGTVAGSFLWY